MRRSNANDDSTFIRPDSPSRVRSDSSASRRRSESASAAGESGGTSKPSNLFKFIKGWFPSAKPEQIHDMDLNNLVGKKAWLTVEQNDKGYAKASSASALPTGAEVVAIPEKFKRKEERIQAQTPAAAPAPVMAPQAPLPTHVPDFIGGNDDLPF